MGQTSKRCIGGSHHVFSNNSVEVVNVVWNKKDTITKIKEENKDEEKQKELINEFCRQLRNIKTDILEITTEYKSDVKYHNWIKEIKKTITPNKVKYQKDSLYYDLQCNPQDYLPCMIIMMKEIEKYKIMIYNVFPMRNDIIMKSIKLDTTTLVLLLFDKQKHGNKTDYLLEGVKLFKRNLINQLRLSP